MNSSRSWRECLTFPSGEKPKARVTVGPNRGRVTLRQSCRDCAVLLKTHSPGCACCPVTTPISTVPCLSHHRWICVASICVNMLKKNPTILWRLHWFMVRDGWRNTEKLLLGASARDGRKNTAAVHAVGESGNFQGLSSCARTSGPSILRSLTSSSLQSHLSRCSPSFLCFYFLSPSELQGVFLVSAQLSRCNRWPVWVRQVIVFCTVVIAFPLRHLPWWWFLHSVLYLTA